MYAHILSPIKYQQFSKSNLHNWYLYDTTLEADLKKEREIISTGAHTLRKANRSTLSLWLYGHYHDIYFNNFRMNAELSYFEPIRFIGLDMMRSSYDVSSLNSDTYNFYNRKHKLARIRRSSL